MTTPTAAILEHIDRGVAREAKRRAIVARALLSIGVNASDARVAELAERFRAKPIKNLRRSVVRAVMGGKGGHDV